MATTFTLAQMRTKVRERADMVNSTFVLDPELNGYINASYAELYDLLIQKYGNNYYVATPYTITTDGTNDQYALPATFYKLLGVDLAVSGTSSYIPIDSFNFNERNGCSIPSSGQTLRLWFAPKITYLTLDADTLDGISGWEEYIVIDGAIKCLLKEESDVSELLVLKQMITKRIESASENRDAGRPATVVDSTLVRRRPSIRYRLNGNNLWLAQYILNDFCDYEMFGY